MDGSGKSASLREVMSSYPTGVTVVTGCDAEGVPYGLTVNSFTSLSLDPPLVLVCIGRGSSCHDRLVSASHFTINVLSAGQSDIAARFSSSPSERRFDDVRWNLSPHGAPVLDEGVAWLDCSVHEVMSGGDHSVLLGTVEGAATSDRPALMFYRGRLRATPA
jgi:flavin reductase (DIM6/NTAB) family NADH-FMN oxidoreductase RutF